MIYAYFNNCITFAAENITKYYNYENDYQKEHFIPFKN